MKTAIFLNGLCQMLDFIGQDLDVYVEVNIDGKPELLPLKSVKAGTDKAGLILSTINQN